MCIISFISFLSFEAMSKLEKEKRKYVWKMLRQKSDDPNDIAAVINLLDSVNAIDDCLKEARDIVRNTWELLDAVVEDFPPGYSQDFVENMLKHLATKPMHVHAVSESHTSAMWTSRMIKIS